MSRDCLDNELDRMLLAAGETLQRGDHPLLADRSSRDANLLSTVFMWWVGCGDPYAQGSGQCAFSSFIIRRLLSLAGIDNEAVTVQVTVKSFDSSTVSVVGSLRPRLKRFSPNGVKEWTGHEVVHVPDWNLVFDATLFQAGRNIGEAAALCPALAGPVRAHHRG
jgi:hypothetical protein